jgi:hypothetical protein
MAYSVGDHYGGKWSNNYPNLRSPECRSGHGMSDLKNTSGAFSIVDHITGEVKVET